MAIFNNNEIEGIGKFFQGVTSSAVKILSGSLDKEVYKSFNIVVDSLNSIEGIESLKGNNVFYKLDYAKEATSSELALLIPEELISNISDVVMGGKGEDSYKGSLSELEITAATDLLKKIFKDIESTFKHKHNRDLAFNTDVSMLLKETPEYEDAFENSGFDFVIKHILRINEEKEYIINLLLKVKDLKHTMATSKIFQEGMSGKLTELDSIGIEQLSDIKIDITAELGRARVPIKYALELVRGSIIGLDTVNNSDIKVFANGIEVAQAQVVVIEDNFGLKITKIISPEERLKFI